MDFSILSGFMGTCVGAISLMIYRRTHLFYAGLLASVIFAVLFGCLMCEFGGYRPLMYDSQEKILIFSPVSASKFRISILCGAISAATLGSVISIFPGCFMRFVCRETDQGKCLELLIYMSVGCSVSLFTAAVMLISLI
jgi:hypothetical protein